MQGGREELPQRHTQTQQVPGPFPDQRLVRPGDHLDRLGLRTVTGHGTQLMPLGAHHIGQRVRIGGVTLGPRGDVALLEPGYLLGIEPVHPIAGRQQRLHPQAPVGLDPNHDLPGVIGLAQMLTDQLVQLADPGRSL